MRYSEIKHLCATHSKLQLQACHWLSWLLAPWAWQQLFGAGGPLNYRPSSPNSPKLARLFLLARLLLKFPTLYSGFAKCKQIFTKLDADKDGRLGMEELQLCCAKLGYRYAGLAERDGALCALQSFFLRPYRAAPGQQPCTGATGDAPSACVACYVHYYSREGSRLGAPVPTAASSADAPTLS